MNAGEGGLATVRGIGNQISVLAGHDVIVVALGEGRDHCAHCRLWVDTSRLMEALLGRVKQADARVRVTKTWPGGRSFGQPS